MTQKKKPKTTAVIVSRNDNYGGNLIERATICLSHMIVSFDEVIYVDYNSKGNTLVDEIKEKLPLKGNLKVITVTPEQHKEFTKGDKDVQPVVEVLGRNIGIRRATGDIIVSTNIDIIPPPKDVLDKFLNTWYDDHSFYTFSRRNIQIDGGVVKYTFNEDFRTSLITHMYEMEPKGSANARGPSWCRIMCCGDFQLACKDIWYKVKGFEESMVYRFESDAQVQMKAGLLGYSVKGLFDMPVFHIQHGYDKHLESKFNKGSTGVTTNSDTWGFSEIDFEEEIL